MSLLDLTLRMGLRGWLMGFIFSTGTKMAVKYFSILLESVEICVWGKENKSVLGWVIDGRAHGGNFFRNSWSRGGFLTAVGLRGGYWVELEKLIYHKIEECVKKNRVFAVLQTGEVHQQHLIFLLSIGTSQIKLVWV